MIVSLGLLLFFILLTGVLLRAPLLLTFDQTLTHLIRQPVTPERTWFFRNITRLGNVKFTLVVMIIFSLGLWWRQKLQGALFFAINVGVLALVVNTLIKHLVARPRPLILHLVAAGGFSFPSGHAMNVTLMYGSLIILCNLYVDRFALRAVFNALLTLLIITICLSRVYLGVHFPSDVVAGASLALAELLISRYLFFGPRSVSAIRLN
ncbi:hypothetical protein JCM31185_00740 [Furfurilactobacillus curtus]|uniref:Phosphatidic acid phosphatase type 2/haloperoxidase domain-containing protein n=1 Tax=Furfurilactobacillus curtus TaxID=1746200 RepID=A0ABQ5JLJ0_9LACO